MDRLSALIDKLSFQSVSFALQMLACGSHVDLNGKVANAGADFSAGEIFTGAMLQKAAQAAPRPNWQRRSRRSRIAIHRWGLESWPLLISAVPQCSRIQTG